MVKQTLTFAISTSLVFFLFSSFMAWHHEIWIDESYHYLLSKVSSSPVNIIQNAGITGHPILWNIVLMYYKSIAPTVFEMQILHCFIAACCVFLICRFSPFSITEKLLISFGYFFIYEYSIIAKNYILGFTLVFIALVLFGKRKSFWLIALLLGLAANLHLFTLFISVVLFIYIILSLYKEISTRLIIISLIVFVILIGIASLQIIPSQSTIQEYEAHNNLPIFSFLRFKRAFGTFGKGLVNIPDFRTNHFWNSNIIANAKYGAIYLLSAALLFCTFYIFRKRSRIALLFFSSVTLIMIFIYLSPLSVGTRYWGYYYILLIICFWLLRREDCSGIFPRYFFGIILWLQFFVAIPSLYLDYKLPFSNAKNAAQLLSEKKFDKYPYFSEVLALGPSMSAYSGKEIYYPSNKTYETFSYRIIHKKYEAQEFIEESIADLNSMKIDTCVLLLSHELPNNLNYNSLNKFSIEHIASLNDAIFGSENYFIYLLSRKND